MYVSDSTRFRPNLRVVVPGVFVVLMLAVGAFIVSQMPSHSTAKEIRRFDIDNSLMNNAIFTPDGRYVIATARRDDMTMWNIVDGTRTLIGKAEGSPSANFATISADGSLLVTAGLKTRVWDMQTKALLRTIPPGPDDPNDTSTNAYRAALSPDGTRIATLYTPYERERGGKVYIHNVRTGRGLGIIEASAIDFAISLAWSPDGTRIVTGGGNKGIANVWDAATGALLLTLEGNPRLVTGVGWSPDGRYIATANDYDMAIIWDAWTGERVRTIRVSPPLWLRELGLRPYGDPRERTTSVAFSPDSTLVAFGSSDATAGIWNVATGDRMLSIFGHTDTIRSVEFSPDGTMLLTSSDDYTVRVWDVQDAYK